LGYLGIPIFQRRHSHPKLPEIIFSIEATKYPQHHGVPFHQIFPFPRILNRVPPADISDMKKQLPESLYHLVEHTEPLTTILTVTQCLTQQQPIGLACSGGAYPGKASYGWILQIGNTGDH
jgi:hypothetical protein